MASVKFEDFSDEVKDAMESEIIAWLHEAGGALVKATVNNTPSSTWHSEIVKKWEYKVDEQNLEATVGNPFEQSLWVEFGTGEWSISPKGGRSGYWVYVKDSRNGLTRNYAYKGGKQYTLEEAKKIVAMMKADGLDAHLTNGQKPHRPLQTAYNSKEAAIKKALQRRMKGLGK